LQQNRHFADVLGAPELRATAEDVEKGSHTQNQEMHTKRKSEEAKKKKLKKSKGQNTKKHPKQFQASHLSSCSLTDRAYCTIDCLVLQGEQLISNGGVHSGVQRSRSSLTYRLQRKAHFDDPRRRIRRPLSGGLLTQHTWRYGYSPGQDKVLERFGESSSSRYFYLTRCGDDILARQYLSHKSLDRYQS